MLTFILFSKVRKYENKYRTKICDFTVNASIRVRIRQKKSKLTFPPFLALGCWDVKRSRRKAKREREREREGERDGGGGGGREGERKRERERERERWVDKTPWCHLFQLYSTFTRYSVFLHTSASVDSHSLLKTTKLWIQTPDSDRLLSKELKSSPKNIPSVGPGVVGTVTHRKSRSNHQWLTR